jgi:large subunit ribosomal protein L29
MKITEIRELSTDELQTKARDLNQEIFNLRMQQATGQLEKPSQIRQLRRDVARVETVLSERANQTAK